MELIVAFINLGTASIGFLPSLVSLAAVVVALLSEASGPRETKNRRR